MPPLVKHQQLAEAVLNHVQLGVYPEGEDIISANLQVSALPDVLKFVEQARTDLKTNIQRQSGTIAPDVDGWISQAKQLRADVESSEDDAHNIVKLARHGKELEEGVTDAAKKVSLLEDELAFNHGVRETLQRLQAIRQQLDHIQHLLLSDNLSGAVDMLKGVDGEIETISAVPTEKVASIFSARSNELRQEAVDNLTRYWHKNVKVEKEALNIVIKGPEENSGRLNLESTAQTLKKLGTFEQVLVTLCREIETLILFPRLHVQSDGLVDSFEVENDMIFRTEPSSDLSAEALFSDLQILVTFLREHLPEAVTGPLASRLMPDLINRLISTWLASAVPENLDNMKDFQVTVEMVQAFSKTLDTIHWPGKAHLDEWVKDIPNIWIRKHQETSLAQVRFSLSKTPIGTEVVERVETQVLSQDDEVFAGNKGGDDWNASWSDDDETSPVKTTLPNHIPINEGINDEQDVSAWGLDDEMNDDEDPAVAQRSLTGEDDDSVDAWGWTEDDNGHQSPRQANSSPAAKSNSITGNVNGVRKSSKKVEREITLRETYTITLLPKEVLEIINHVVSDLEKSQNLKVFDLSGAKSASSLPALPGLILAMFRAGSPTTYLARISGNMFLYNDCLWLAEQLRNISKDTNNFSGKATMNRFNYDLSLSFHISALESHGKRAYAKEMESQRTIIKDLLDGAQGFAHCTEHPFRQECDVAIASVTDRLRQLHNEWTDVLSQSALLQTLGSLLSTVCSKIIMDVEDLSDISEPESQQLNNYSSQISALKDLFTPQNNNASTQPSEEVAALTAVYTPAWLKFQYLAEILESSLADIKFLWTEGELSLEFETEELVDLIVALFADSPYRRTGISEIRTAHHT